MDRVVVDLEAPRLSVRQDDPIQGGVFKIHHPMALNADQVMVPLDSPVKPGSPSGVLEPANGSQLSKRLQHAVHGRPGQPGNPPSHCLVDLLRRGMVLSP